LTNAFIPIVTEDGSVTYYNKEFSDYYHSRHGAVREARELYVLTAMHFFEQTFGHQHSEMTVLDACAGVGYNTFSFVEYWRQHRFSGMYDLRILMVDNDPKTAELMKTAAENYKDMQQAASNLFRHGTHTEIVQGTNGVRQIFIKRMQADIRRFYSDEVFFRTIQNSWQFDAVFHDPFTPSRCPSLWCEEFFQSYQRCMKDNAILITYSNAVPVRAGLFAAGFKVKPSMCPGKKKSGITAYTAGSAKSDALWEAVYLFTSGRLPYRRPEENRPKAADETAGCIEQRKREINDLLLKNPEIKKIKTYLKQYLKTAAAEKNPDRK